MAQSPTDPPQLTLAEVLDTDFLRCPQCHEPFTAPTLLPCLHAFCTHCIDALPHTSVTNGNNNKMVQLTCPLCRSEVTTPTAMSPDPFLQSLCQLRGFKQSACRICSYCKFDGKSEPADSLCLDCADDMCEPCAKAHRKTRVTRDHVIAPYRQIQNGLYDHDIRARHGLRCERHGSEVEALCCDCLLLTCSACRTDGHRGHALEAMATALARLQPEAHSFVQGLRKRGPALADYQTFLQSHLRQLEDQKSQLTASVKQQAEAIHTLVDQYRDSTIREIEDAFTRERSEIASRSKDLDTAKQSLHSNAHFLTHLLSLGSPSEVLHLHPLVMARLKQLIHMKTNTLTHRLALAFQPGPATQQNMHIMFGKLDVRRVPIDQEDSAPKARLSISTLLPEPLDPPNLVCAVPVKQTTDPKEVWPSGLHVRKEKMVVVDRDNKKVKIFDCTSTPPTLKFQFSGKGEHQLINPFDAILLENGVVVVSDHGAEKVKVFDVTGRWIGDLAGEFRHPRGLAVTAEGHLVVVDGLLLRLTVHDPESGKLLYTVPPKDTADARPLVDPFYVAVMDQGHFVVTDHAAPNIRIFSRDGASLTSYGTYGTSASEVLKPYGVCVDRYGQVLIADSDNHRVHLLLPDGTFSQFLLTHQHRVSHPVSVAINTDGHLVVGEAFGSIKIFKYL
ncbi:E3 ubiquitin-protein ligase TRIM56-like [Babylonia areolata]|uniref:E3 ubiquitin-protein ligase TRIM56-like n=1 Tax=Babylonia areolata TaxID=304850 RepID=UPI003FD276B0